MAKHRHHLRQSLLICLFAFWPLAPICHAAEPAPARIEVSRSAPLDADDPLQRWFAEQDKVLDDILVRLGRIEILVKEIHRLIAQLPDRMQSSVAPAPTVTPKPPAPPAVSVPATAAPETGLVTDWLPLAAGLLAMLGLGLWWSRRRKVAASAQPAATQAAPTTPTPTPISAPPPQPAKTAAAPQTKKPEPVKPAAASSIQTGGASQVLNSQPDQALELAEIMLSMGLGHGAAQTLAEQIRSEPKQGLRQWLKLLEIYRRNGQQDEFERSSEELRLHFNVQAEDWNTPSESQRSIEDYPHIAARMVELWGKPSCLSYLQNLLDDNRGGARSGFPQSVAEEFLLLTTLLKDRLKSGD